MPRRHPYAWTLLGLAILLGSCSEKLELLEPWILILSPDGLTSTFDDTLTSTINDVLWFTGVYLGDGEDVARHSWDFNSDGIFDFEWTNYGGDGDSLSVSHAYSRADTTYTVTLQLSTVDNRLYRTGTYVRITDSLPLLAITVSDSELVCGELIEVSGEASDDAGEYAFWDFNGDGIHDLSAEFEDEVTLEAEISFDDPGVHTILFGADDNDGHREELSFDITVGVPPSWTTVASMSQPRADHAAVAYDGEIYVFGGRHTRGPLPSVEIYNISSDSWRDGSEMPTARWGLGAVAVGNSIFVVGGVTAADTVFPRVEIYDPLADAWETFPADSANSMPFAKRGFAMLQVGEKYAGGDSLLLFGGTTDGEPLSSNLIYNTLTRTWSTDTNPHSGLTPGRAWLGAMTIWEDENQISGQMLALGGTSDGITPCGIFERYHPFNDFWSSETPLPTPRIAPAVAYHGGKIYVFGGSLGTAGATGAVEVYSQARELWDVAEPMPEPRSGARAVTLAELIYVIGGATSATSPYYVEGSAEVQVLIPWRCAP